MPSPRRSRSGGRQSLDGDPGLRSAEGEGQGPRLQRLAVGPEGSGTRVTIYNVLEGHGIGKLFAPLALRSARKGADQFARAIKTAVEAS